MSAVVVAGDTSGSVTLQAPAVAGTTVLTLPATTGTVALTSNIPAAQWTTTGSDIYYSTGNVGIGTSSPSKKLHVIDTSLLASSTTPIYQLSSSYTSTANAEIGRISVNGYSSVNSAYSAAEISFIGGGAGAYLGNIIFSTNGVDSTVSRATERMRIASNGQVQINTTGFTSAAGQVEIAGDGSNVRNPLSINSTTSGTASSPITAWMRNYTYTGGIAITGTTTAYNTSSDYRLKDNVAPMTGALARVALLKPVTYSWKIDGSTGEGFIAHELQEVCPLAVTGEKDAVFEDGSVKSQSIDVSFLVATLTAAIQEQQALIENLTTRLSALENK